MMKSKLINCFGKVFGKALRCHVLCLIVLCVIVGCADEAPGPMYIASPYTAQTIEFFERSGSEGRGMQLRSIATSTKKYILKNQPRKIQINLERYTLETVPEKLVDGIKFKTLIIRSDGHCVPAVLERVLVAFGTINTDRLEVFNLNINDEFEPILLPTAASLPGVPSKGLSMNPPPTRCILNTKDLTIICCRIPGIIWFQERVSVRVSVRVSSG
ncbi:hypothetical protein NEDG_02031 [Nematocida displodere]|uniref:Lipoprotein n=1 Tax=Nematocida displodere TaxID=1805483 RepID=A0A177ELN1_9MICR|nr:hypothetical protein NEDG_02031 [Nematocida displodere]